MQVSKLILVITREYEIYVWHDDHLSAGLLLKRPRKGKIQFYAGIWPCCKGGFSTYVAILTKLIQQITQHNQLSVSLSQHEFNKFCNLNQLILKKGGFIPVLANRKKGIFLLKIALLGESQGPVRRLSSQISSFRFNTH